MTEYWVSKKQYWCKYCSIWIRDDAPSRRQHETGLKHQGQKERYIRDLYKSGNIQKREKAAEAAEIAKIEAAAARAHAADTNLPTSRPHPDLAQEAEGSSSSSSSRVPRPPSGPVDKFANYSTASQLGFNDEETQKSSYEIEQMVRGRGTVVGKWEEVAENEAPHGLYSDTGELSGKRKVGDEEEGEEWKFAHKGKKAVHDPYDDEDWDPKKALGGLKSKMKVKEERRFGAGSTSAAMDPGEMEGALKRDGWGKLEIKFEEEQVQEQDQEYQKVKQGNNAREGEGKTSGIGNGDVLEKKPIDELDIKPVLPDPVLLPPTEDLVNADSSHKGEGPLVPNSLFKKRRPPPSSRTK